LMRASDREKGREESPKLTVGDAGSGQAGGRKVYQRKRKKRNNGKVSRYGRREMRGES